MPRDYFLLGTLAAAASLSLLPKGCSDRQAQRLARTGYPERATSYTADGWAVVRYHSTEPGRAAWHAYGFADDCLLSADPRIAS